MPAAIDRDEAATWATGRIPIALWQKVFPGSWGLIRPCPCGGPWEVSFRGLGIVDLRRMAECDRRRESFRERPREESDG